MSTVVIEQIAQKIATRLAGVSGATVVRPKRIGSDPGIGNKYIWLIQGDAFKNEDASAEGNPKLQAWDQAFHLDVFMRETDADTLPMDQRINTFIGQIITKLTEPSLWETWEGLAIETNFTDVQPFPPIDGTHSGAELTMNVLYRHRENDPYTVG